MGVPPAKNGDYAFLLHILSSLKSTGKGAVILPHGVLFRGHAEANIRRNLVRQGYIKGIIGLPPNLFYGTGIPACIVVLDKENAPHQARHLHDRREPRLHEGRQQEPPPQPGHAQDRGRVQARDRGTPLLAHGRLRRDREERIQPEHPALHRLQRSRGHPRPRRAPERRHPRTGHRCALTVLEGVPEPPPYSVRRG